MAAKQSTDPVAILNRMVALRDRMAQLQEMREAKMQVLLAPLEKRIKLVEDGFTKAHGPLAAEYAELEAAAKEAVLKAKGTVNGTYVAKDGTAPQCVYAKPRTTWDMKKLEGVALLIPAVAQCRTTAPTGSAALRWVKTATEE